MGFELRKKKLQELGKDIILRDISNEWLELIRETDDSSAIAEIILDDNYIWMSIDVENEKSVYRLLIKLIKNKQTLKNTDITLKCLEDKLNALA